MSAGDARRELSERMFLNDDVDDPLFRTPYKTMRIIGRGGMAEVREAVHLPLGKLVVVKLIHPELSSPDLVERLRVEAQTLAQLSHPNLVEVTDLGATPAGRPYMVLERLIGRSLADEVKKRTFLPVQEAVDVACDILDALGAAHEQGVVHRDVKLDNVFLHQPKLGPRVTKLIDFGVAKILAGNTSGVAPTRFPTEEGMLIGTPRFCSPEQARAGLVDHRADIYGVGVLLYTLLAGRRPFEQRGLIEMLHAHAVEPPEPLAKTAEQSVPADIESAVLRALEKRPENRFQSAAAFADALRASTKRKLADAKPASADLPLAKPLPRKTIRLAPTFRPVAPAGLTDNEPTAIVPMMSSPAARQPSDEEPTVIAPVLRDERRVFLTIATGTLVLATLALLFAGWCLGWLGQR